MIMYEIVYWKVVYLPLQMPTIIQEVKKDDKSYYYRFGHNEAISEEQFNQYQLICLIEL